VRPAQHLHFLSYPVAYECQGISEGGNVQGSKSVPRRRPTGIFNRDRWTSVEMVVHQVVGYYVTKECASCGIL